MSKKWWLITFGLLLAVVGFTYLDMSLAVPHDPPGVYRRWYDRTLEKVEDIDSKGKLRERTLYGDDGKTILRHEHYHYVTDKLTELDERLPDGMMRKQRFEDDGTTLISEQVWSADESVLIEKRDYFKGKLSHEEIKTEDGKFTLVLRNFYTDGTLQFQQTLEKTGDQVGIWNYASGKIQKKMVIHLGGGWQLLRYYEDGTVKEDRTETATTVEIKRNSKDGKPQEQWQITRGKERIISVFTDGKLSFRQTWTFQGVPTNYDNEFSTKWQLNSIDEFDANGKVARHLQATSAKTKGWEVHKFQDGVLVTKRYFRAASKSVEVFGSLEIEETLDKDQTVTKTEEFPDSKDIRENVSYDRFKLPSGAYDRGD